MVVMVLVLVCRLALCLLLNKHVFFQFQSQKMQLLLSFCQKFIHIPHVSNFLCQYWKNKVHHLSFVSVLPCNNQLSCHSLERNLQIVPHCLIGVVECWQK